MTGPFAAFGRDVCAFRTGHPNEAAHPYTPGKTTILQVTWQQGLEAVVRVAGAAVGSWHAGGGAAVGGRDVDGAAVAAGAAAECVVERGGPWGGS